ncbi:MAG: transposase [Xenococcaceae cyanobacterium MO_207.B15]|nr:transposase [Xenococcaceae cyanobacterium MO_207.B15]
MALRRFWWNRSLAMQYEHRSLKGRWLKRTELNAMLPQLKKELPWLKTDCYSQVLQATSKHLEQALKNWFEGRAKKPRFKAKSNRQSISFPQNVKVVNNQIKVPKVGLIDAVITLEIEGTIKTVTLCVTPSGKYFASVGLDEELSEPLTSTDGVVTGIDLGLKDYVTCHNGNESYSVKHPKWLKRHEHNLRHQQKQLSRRKKGSNRRKKARQLLASVHERLSNARQDFLHKLSRKITALSQVVVVENLNIKGMIKKRCDPAEVPSAKERAPRHRKLSKAIAQSGWGMFLNFLDYKLKHFGGVLVEIERFFPSSKLCSNCGHKYQDLQLCEREWTCEVCNTKHSRDENAAKNIRLEGMRILGLGHSHRGDDVRLETCFEQLSVKRVPTESLL